MLSLSDSLIVNPFDFDANQKTIVIFTAKTHGIKICIFKLLTLIIFSSPSLFITMTYLVSRIRCKSVDYDSTKLDENTKIYVTSAK